LAGSLAVAMLDYPQIHRGQIKAPVGGAAHVGLDFEFYPETYKPTALGISIKGVASSLWWDRQCNVAARDLADCGVSLVGHNALGAEDEVMKRLGHTVPLERWEDTMILLYLVHPEFTSETKSSDEDESHTRGIGFLDLWSMASLYTDLPQWKKCRGDNCSGPFAASRL